MAHGAAQGNLRQDRKEIDRLLGRECLSPLAKTKVGAKRVLKEVQERAVQLHPIQLQLRLARLHHRLHQKLLLHALPKIRRTGQQGNHQQ
jgi:hypothetical protein